MGSRFRNEPDSKTAKLQQRIKDLEEKIVEMEARENSYRRTLRRISAETEVNAILAGPRSPRQASTKILQALCERLGWKLGILWNVDRNTNLLYCVESWYRPSVRVQRFEQASKQRTFTPGVGLPGRILSSGKPNWIIDVVKDLNFPRAPFAAKDDLHSACGFPILVGSEILGVMEFFCSDIQGPDEDLLHFMGEVGSRIGDFSWNNWHESALWGG
jgi:transcriptional regulator with GAF, ATPase, and Fis domain